LNSGNGEFEGGSRVAIILSGSPLYSGQAGSGESEIRKWILENDLLEGIVAMPDEMFYNTEIGTYIWVLNNRKSNSSKGSVRLIDAREMGTRMRKSLGDKKKELNAHAIEEITKLYSEALINKSNPKVKVMTNEEFGFARITIERPLRRVWKVNENMLSTYPIHAQQLLEKLIGRTFTALNDLEDALSQGGIAQKEISIIAKLMSSTDSSAEPLIGKKGLVESDPDLRDNENIALPSGFMRMNQEQQIESLSAAANSHLRENVIPYAPDAWVDHSKTKIGYEIPFTRQFYTYSPPRPVEEIRTEIENVEKLILQLMGELN